MLALLAVVLAAPPALVHRRAERFTTEIELTVRADVPAAQVDAAFAAVLAECDRLDALVSEWRPDTAVSRLNRSAGGDAVAVPAELMGLLKTAVELAALTEGAFDPTFATLADLWRLKPAADFRPPDAAVVKARLPAVGFRHLILDEAAGTARLDDARTRIGLGGIAKGYAVERAVALLRARGLTDFCLRAGGELYCAGDKAPGVPWTVGVRDPRDAEAVVATLAVRDAAFTTSGDYERFAEHGGVRYHHILDLRTGFPARGVRSVTLLARRPTEADALSTGVFVLGVERGLALIERLPAAEAVIVDDAGALHVSSGLRGATTPPEPSPEPPR
ncbi:MAG: FAD:protein FMN transferase [Myxococcales bacterium]|nr:FAD:protein FMN transferase [Myxococcales bacterium]MCB9540477.1 FAD:protein FMN transferase [Myxococcales bacterium]